MKSKIIFVLLGMLGVVPMTFAQSGRDLANVCGLAQGCTATIAAGVFPTPQVAMVITPSVTYGPGLGSMTQKNSIIAAGAPTSAFVELPAVTANVGKAYILYNQGSNPVAIVPKTGVINVGGALTPFSCTTLKRCVCDGLTTGVWGCAQS